MVHSFGGFTPRSVDPVALDPVASWQPGGSGGKLPTSQPGGKRDRKQSSSLLPGLTLSLSRTPTKARLLQFTPAPGVPSWILSLWLVGHGRAFLIQTTENSKHALLYVWGSEVWITNAETCIAILSIPVFKMSNLKSRHCAVLFS